MSVFPEKDAAGERDKEARDKKSAIKGEQQSYGPGKFQQH
jgi:hypothetical protein